MRGQQRQQTLAQHNLCKKKPANQQSYITSPYTYCQGDTHVKRQRSPYVWETLHFPHACAQGGHSGIV